MSGRALWRPLENALTHSQTFREGHAILDLGREDRDTAFGGHLANLPANHRIPNFAGNHKPTFEGFFVLLSFLDLFDG